MRSACVGQGQLRVARAERRGGAQPNLEKVVKAHMPEGWRMR